MSDSESSSVGPNFLGVGGRQRPTIFKTIELTEVTGHGAEVALTASNEGGGGDPKPADGARVVSTWHVTVNGSAPGMQLKLYSNGHVNRPDAPTTWTQDGTTLTIKWKNGFVDRCTISPDGKTYKGKNQQGMVIRGERTD